MGDVVDLGAWRNRLVDQLVADFTASGSASAEVTDLVEAKDWRRTARVAAKQLGRPVRTGLAPGGGFVWAALSDWPATPEEEIERQARLRRVVEAAARLPPEEDPPGR